jgi:hypothetical protein
MGRFVLGLVVLVAIAVGVGFYLGWFDFSARRDAQKDEVNLKVGVDVGRIKSDTAAAKEKVKDFGESVKDKFQRSSTHQSAKGTVDSVNATDSWFKLTTTDDKSLTIDVEPTSQVRLRDDAIPLKDLRAGDRVAVDYEVKDGKTVAQKVTVERAE